MAEKEVGMHKVRFRRDNQAAVIRYCARIEGLLRVCIRIVQTAHTLLPSTSLGDRRPPWYCIQVLVKAAHVFGIFKRFYIKYVCECCS